MDDHPQSQLVKIDEVIEQAKNRGVDFGKGDPRHRLRYYAKLDLIPPAQRKCFEGNQPTGAYPKHVVDLLVDIDKKLKQGKSIREVAQEEKEKKEEKQKAKSEPEVEEEKDLRRTEVSYEQPPLTLTPTYRKKIKKKEVPESKQREPRPPRAKSKLSLVRFKSVFKIAVFILSIGILGYIFGIGLFGKDITSYFLASFPQLAQKPPKARETGAPPGKRLEKETEIPTPEPYLTINAETDINAPLNLKREKGAPILSFHQGGFKGDLTVSSLTENRTYNLPDQSGTVCLTTGNCIGIGGEVTSPGGTPGRLSKFINSNTIADSSIVDLYEGNPVINISEEGKVGIAKTSPEYQLDVEGRIQASGDICTERAGGKCLSDMSVGPIFIGGGGISGSGNSGYLARWTSSSRIENSVLYQSGSNIGIGNTSPSSELDVSGTVTMTGFKMPTNATSGYVLTSDASGAGTWQPAPSGTVPAGTDGDTLRNSGGNWIADSFLYNSGTAIGIGTTSPLKTLTVNGDTLISGVLTVATSGLPQLVLENDGESLKFSVDATNTEMVASQDMIIDSLTGEIRTGSNVSLLNASNATVSGATFLSGANDATVRSSGEYVLRASVPIYPYSMPAQTASTNYVRVSKQFATSSSLASSTPTEIPGTTRRYAFLINYADNVPSVQITEWRVYRPEAAATSTSFSFPGQELASLDEGYPYLTDFYSLPDNDWQLEVKVPSGYSIRIFNILLLVYDKVD